MLLIQISNALTHIHMKGAYRIICTYSAHVCVPSLLGQLAEPHALKLLFFEDVPLVEFMYLVFTRWSLYTSYSLAGVYVPRIHSHFLRVTMDCPRSYRRRLRSLLLCLCEVFPALKKEEYSVCDYSVL